MFSSLSELIFGSSSNIPGRNPDDSLFSLVESEGQMRPAAIVVPLSSEDDEWVIVKNEEETFLLSSEVVTRSYRVDVHEDLSRENFLIENPLSLSSEEIEYRVIKIGRKANRKPKRRPTGEPTTSSNNHSLLRNITLFSTIIPQRNLLTTTNPRALTSISVNQNYHNFENSGKKRRRNYHYQKNSGVNNDRKCGRRLTHVSSS